MMKETTTADVIGDPVITEPELPRIPSGASQLALGIKQAVRRATSGRVHNLSVGVTGTHVVLEGFCSTFHCYQLAQHAAMRMADELAVDNQIEVL